MLGVTFETPSLLLLAVPAALLILAIRRRDGRIAADVREVLAGHEDAEQRFTLAARRHSERTSLLGIALLLLLIAAAGPRYGQGASESTPGPSDVLFLLDVSRSMAAEDLQPNRLTAAKEHVRAFCESASGESMALIAFAGSAHLVVPFTRDTRAFLEMLDPLDELSVERQGTDLAAALTLALSILKRRETAEGGTVFLLTDGEDHQGSTPIVAELLQQNGTILHTVGYGSSRGAKIPTGDPESPFLRDEQGEEILSRQDLASLRPLAEATGGEALEAPPLPARSGADLTVAVAKASPLAKLPRAQSPRPHASQTRYRIPLMLALLLCLASLWLPAPRRKGSTP